MPREPGPAELGEVICKYRLERVLGSGGMGCVYAGRHEILGREAAIKVMHRRFAEDDQFASRFLQEAKLASRVGHPNIVEILDFEVDVVPGRPPRLAYVMQLLRGIGLDRVLLEEKLSLACALNLLAQIADGLDAVHGAGAVHRDIKPQNIFVLDEGRPNFAHVPSVKILDFGIAKTDEAAAYRTETGSELGTVQYMAPEQIVGGEVTAGADVYAFGEILYELLGARRLFRGSPPEIRTAKIKGKIPPLELPTDLQGRGRAADLIDRCLAERSDDRPSLSEVRSEMASIWADHAWPVRRPEPAPRPPHSARLRGQATPRVGRGRRPPPPVPLPTTVPPRPQTPSPAAPFVEIGPTSASGVSGPHARPQRSRATMVIVGVVLMALASWVGFATWVAPRNVEVVRASPPVLPVAPLDGDEIGTKEPEPVLEPGSAPDPVGLAPLDGAEPGTEEPEPVLEPSGPKPEPEDASAKVAERVRIEDAGLSGTASRPVGSKRGARPRQDASAASPFVLVPVRITVVDLRNRTRPEARVYIDGVLRREALPGPFKVAEGEHVFEIEIEGRRVRKVTRAISSANREVRFLTDWGGTVPQD